MIAYWPWWGGALALGLITVGYFLTVHRPLGMSTAMERVLHWSSEREVDRLNAAAADTAAFDTAIAAATAEAFGDTLVAADAPAPPPPPDAPTRLPIRVSTQAMFLASVFIGGVFAALVNGRFELRTDMGETFSEVVIDGWLVWPTVFVGGVMVGFGTRMAGGCSSGHGLSGMARLQPKSLVAVPTFFGTAVAVSLLLWKVI